LRKLLILFLILFSAPLHAQEAPKNQALDLLAAVREQLATDLEVGSLDVARELVGSLAAGQPEDPVLSQQLRDLARKALRARPDLGTPIQNLLAQLEAPPRRLIKPLSPPRPFEFPRDEGGHKKLSEWWYWNGHLQTNAGRRFGFQLCFFRVRTGLAFLHAAVTDEEGQRFVYLREFFRPKKVTISQERLNLKYGEATAQGLGQNRQNFSFQVGPYQVDLTTTPTRNIMNVNGNGVIDMPEGGLSRYYSRTSMATTGTISQEGQPLTVSGSVWFDHQWGNFWSMFRAWDWFCIQMEDGDRYNLFSFRKGLGHREKTYVNVLRPDGSLDTSREMKLQRDRWWKSPRTGKLYVTEWTLGFPDRGETMKIRATLDDQEMSRRGWRDFPPSYWEGSLTVERTDASGHVVRGRSYGEHFAYRKKWPR
jgi:predicted secreted hydrolase